MILDELIQDLQSLADRGFGKMEVRVLCCDDNPINRDGIAIKGAYIIDNHPDKGVNGVYIDGTV